MRQLWAGGKIDYSDLTLTFNGGLAFCLERIADVEVRNLDVRKQAWVRIERRARHYKTGDDEIIHQKPPFGLTEELMRRNYDEAEARDPFEVRHLVFLLLTSRKNAPQKYLHHPYSANPDFSHTLVPSAALLFRFSALTFNAHAIHLDKHYCQEIEGHRNLLVHGPLTIILMVELLRRNLESSYVQSGRLPESTPMIESIEYRNFAPLYAEEKMKICGKQRRDGGYDMWIEGKEGGMAVRGIVKIKRDKTQ